MTRCSAATIPPLQSAESLPSGQPAVQRSSFGMRRAVSSPPRCAGRTTVAQNSCKQSGSLCERRLLAPWTSKCCTHSWTSTQAPLAMAGSKKPTSRSRPGWRLDVSTATSSFQICWPGTLPCKTGAREAASNVQTADLRARLRLSLP